MYKIIFFCFLTLTANAITKNQALKIAAASKYLTPNSQILTVSDTGSMEPVLDKNTIIVIEPAGYTELNRSDIVVYKHPKHSQPVVHRLIKKKNDKWLVRGDNNNSVDSVYITENNYIGRVFSIIEFAE